MNIASVIAGQPNAEPVQVQHPNSCQEAQSV